MKDYRYALEFDTDSINLSTHSKVKGKQIEVCKHIYKNKDVLDDSKLGRLISGKWSYILDLSVHFLVLTNVNLK